MKVEDGELVATGAELAVAPAVLDLPVGALARLPRVVSTVADEQAVAAFFGGARKEAASLFRAMLATLADPARIGVLHYALGEESVTRMILAWGPATGPRAVVMLSRGDGWAIATATPEALTDTLAAVLLERLPLASGRLRVALSQDAACVFLAALHVLRAARLRALLDHQPAPVAFTAKALDEAIENGGIEDSRWPFLFLDKVLPFSLNGVDWTAAIGPALRELTERGLIQPVKGSRETFMLTSRGYPLFVADGQHLTKAGLRITSETGEIKAHETLFFLRAPQDLILVDLGGREGVIAAIPVADLRTLAMAVLTPPAAALAPRPAPAVTAAATCAVCGATLAPGARFCPQCGAPVPQPTGPATCPACGAALAPGARFCPACGAPVKETA